MSSYEVQMEMTACGAWQLIRKYDSAGRRVIMNRISELLRQNPSAEFNTDRLFLRTDVKRDHSGARPIKQRSIDKGLYRVTMDGQLLIYKRKPNDTNSKWDPPRAYSVGFKSDTNELYYIGDKRQECIFWRSGEMDPSYKLVDYVEC